MSTSFYAEDKISLDLNKVQLLPDNLDEFLKQPDADVSTLDVTISDLPEHIPLSDPDNNIRSNGVKQTYDDEKELASPLEPEEKEESPDVKEPFPKETESKDAQKIDEPLAPTDSHSTPLLEDILGLVEPKASEDTHNIQFGDHTNLEPLIDIQSTVDVKQTNETKMGPEVLLEGIQTSEKIEVDLAMEFRSDLSNLEPKPFENAFGIQPEISEVVKVKEDIGLAEGVKEPEIIKIEEESKEPEDIKISENNEVVEDIQLIEDIKVPEVKEDILVQSLNEEVKNLTEKIEFEQDFLENKLSEVDVHNVVQAPIENVDLLAEVECSAPILKEVEKKLPEVIPDFLESSVIETKEIPSQIDIHSVETQLLDLATSANESRPILEPEIIAESEFVKEHVGHVVESLQSKPVVDHTIPSEITDTKSITTTDVDPFLEKSLSPEVASPLNPEPIKKEEVNTEIEIRTERIAAEFAEEAIVSPSEEESKHDDIPVVEEPKPLVEEKKVEEPIKPVVAVPPAVAVPKEPTTTTRKSTGSAPVASKRTSVGKSTTATANLKAKSPSVKAASPKVSAVASSRLG